MEHRDQDCVAVGDIEQPAVPTKMTVPLASRLTSVFAVFLCLNLAATLAWRILRPMTEVWFGAPHRFLNLGIVLCLMPFLFASAVLWLIVGRWQRRLDHRQRLWFPTLSAVILGGLCLLLLIPQNPQITSAVGKDSLYRLAGWICPPMPLGASAGDPLICTFACIVIYGFVLAANCWTILRWSDQEPFRHEGVAGGSFLSLFAGLLTLRIWPLFWKMQVVLSYTNALGDRLTRSMPVSSQFAIYGSGWRADISFERSFSAVLGMWSILLPLLPCYIVILYYFSNASRRERKGIH